MDYRHEWKHTIGRTDVVTLDHRLSIVAKPDAHTPYNVRCLYFEDIYTSALNERHDGASRKEKYRICYYNLNTGLIKLERRSEMNGMSCVESCEVTREFVENILNRQFSAIIKDPMGRTGEELDPLIQDFYWNLIGNGLRPDSLVDYERKAYVYPHGNVNVTIDYHVCSSHDITRFLDVDHSGFPAFEDQILLKVKWDSYLPEAIKSAVLLSGRNFSAFPRYELRNAYL